MKKAINKLMSDWDIKKNIMAIDTANRFYDVIRFCLPDYGKDLDIISDDLAHKIGPFVIKWNESTLLKQCLKGIYCNVFGFSFEHKTVDLKMYIKFLYGLRQGVFNNLKWYHVDHNDFWIHEQISNTLL